MTSTRLDGKRIAVLATDGVEQVELTQPWSAIEDAGGTPVLVSPNADPIQAVNGMDKGARFTPTTTVELESAMGFDGLLLPGGVANPDHLRMDDRAVSLVRSFVDAGTPVAAICHGPWLLVEADAVRGRTLTSYPSLATDIRNAGGTWVDVEVHVEQGIVTSRRPDDLPAFCRKMVEEFSEGSHAERRAS